MIHEGIVANKIDILLCNIPRVWFVLSKSLHMYVSTWSAQHVLGGWSAGKISKEHALRFHQELMRFTEDSGAKYLIYNPESIFLERLLNTCGLEGWLWQKQ